MKKTEPLGTRRHWRRVEYQDRLDVLEAVTDFNLEARYPDEKFSFQQRCTREFTQIWLNKIEDMRQWLLPQIR